MVEQISLARMRLTKFTHACVRLDDGDRSLVIDPGGWGDPGVLDGVDAVLVTHLHDDHIDYDRVVEHAKGDPALRIWTNAQAAEGFSPVADQVTVVEPGERFSAGGFDVRGYGGRHAAVHPDYPVVANTAYLVEGALYHPGDSFAVPDADVDTLLVPVHSGWMKTVLNLAVDRVQFHRGWWWFLPAYGRLLVRGRPRASAIDFVRMVRPRRSYPIHDGFMNEIGRRSADGHLRKLGRTNHSRLDPGDSTELTG
jgi:glyoxylase-like metal-dependent hydrolase (beta-lactamase superfamily II)